MQKTINLAVIADLEELIRLLTELFTQDIEFEPDYQKQKTGLEMILNNREIGEILVLKSDDKIIGMISLLYSISNALGAKVAILEDMVIDKSFRNRGYGKELLSEAINHAKHQHCMRLTLLTDFNNDVAIKFYKSFGFNLSEMVPLRLVF
jgi:GNAT superfamily N-acetyltransferase